MTLAMSWTEWSRHDATALAERVRKGEVPPAELAAQAEAAVAKINPATSAVVELFADAIASPTTDGTNTAGAFAGVPYLMKDLGPTLRGRRQEMGALLMMGHTATQDSFLTTKIRQAGLNIIGRTTTPEFGTCGSVENERVYVSKNPWNPAYTTGGSSAGTGVVVATGALPISHASDGGGSIRIPAGINGNIGLKPSRGVFSPAPGGSDLMALVSTQGCHSRTIRDTALFFDTCRGPAPGEFMPFWTAPEPYTTLIQRDPGKLRIAVSHEWGDYKATPHIAAELERAGKLLQSLGHHVEWKTPTVDFRAGYDAQTTCYITNIAQNVERLSHLRGHATPPRDLIESMNWRIWDYGRNFTYTQRADMQAGFNATSRAFGNFFTEWDIILTPISTQTTHKRGTMDFLTLNTTDSPLEWFEKLWGMYAYTPLANLTGTPGLSLPMASHDNGLPLGIQALAAQGNDGLLLQLGAQIERALGGKWNNGELPGVHVTR